MRGDWSMPSEAARLEVARESWPLARTFTISRGSRTRVEVVVVELCRGGLRGRGECVPYARYGETVEATVAALRALEREAAAGLDRGSLQEILPAGAARNGLDCALWDLEAKAGREGSRRNAGPGALKPVTTAYTLSLDTPEKMARAARDNMHRPLLKVKLGGEGDLERVAAVRENAPAARLIVDANEGWTEEEVEPFCAGLAGLGVALVEQPLPAGKDGMLAHVDHPVPLCADESCHTAEDVEMLASAYDFVNIKLDKAGGLTAAFALARKARSRGLGIMVGCMVGTSLAMAPAVLLAQEAEFVDLDGPLLLAADRECGLEFEGSLLHPPRPELWG